MGMMFAVHTYPTKDLFLEDRKTTTAQSGKGIVKRLESELYRREYPGGQWEPKKVPSVILVNRKM